MTEHLQEIFKGQDQDHNANMVANFLLQDDDPAPYEEFLWRRIPDHLRNELEGLLTQTELDEALQNDMKPNSAPGIDGFTVKFLKIFWPCLLYTSPSPRD